MSESLGDGFVARKRATSQSRVEKMDPVELLRTRDRVIVFSGTDVEHNSGPQFTGELIQRKPSEPEKIVAKIRLDERAMVRLAGALQSVPAVQEAGSAVVIPGGGNAPTGRLRDVVEKLAAEPELLKQLDADTLAKLELGLHQVRRIATMTSALAELDDLLQNEAAESAYQAWCARNGWAFGVDYGAPDGVRSIAAEDHVDFLIPRLTGFRDVIELKRPDMKPLAQDASHGTWYWSGETSKAIAQVLRYIEKLAQNAEHGLADHREIVALKPVGTVVIGRSNAWSDEQRKWFVRLNASLHGVQVMTYDDLRSRAARMLELVAEAHEPGE